MLHIVLLILKIIGILLLCILGILLLGILSVLFVPVRYRIALSREEGEGNPPFVVRAKITWLLHAVNIHIRYPAGKAFVRVRLFFFTLFRIPEKQERSDTQTKKSGKTKRNRKTGKPKTMSEAGDRRTGNAAAQTTAYDSVETDTRLPNADAVEVLNDKRSETAPDQPPHTDIHPRSGEHSGAPAPAGQAAGQKRERKLAQKLRDIIQKIKNIFHKIKDLIQNIQYTIRRFCDKIRFVSEQVGYYRELIASDVFQQSLQLCKGELAHIFKMLKPQKLEADLTIGTDDPALTGEILAVFGILYPLIGEHVHVTGDFEQNRIEGHVFIKGRIRAITFIRTAVKIYFNKDIRKLIKLLKKEAV